MPFPFIPVAIAGGGAMIGVIGGMIVNRVQDVFTPDGPEMPALPEIQGGSDPFLFFLIFLILLIFIIMIK